MRWQGALRKSADSPSRVALPSARRRSLVAIARADGNRTRPAKPRYEELEHLLLALGQLRKRPRAAVGRRKDDVSRSAIAGAKIASPAPTVWTVRSTSSRPAPFSTYPRAPARLSLASATASVPVAASPTTARSGGALDERPQALGQNASTAASLLGVHEGTVAAVDQRSACQATPVK